MEITKTKKLLIFGTITQILILIIFSQIEAYIMFTLLLWFSLYLKWNETQRDITLTPKEPKTR